jgi:hypothetical protein
MTPEQIVAEQQRVAAEKKEQELVRSRALLDAAWTNPELRPGLRKLIKEKFPDHPVIDDQFDAISAPLKAQIDAQSAKIDELLGTLKQRDEDAAKREAERRDQDYEANLRAARQKFALTDEGFEQMVARMKATGNYTDPDAAAAYVVSQAPPAIPSGPMYGSGYVNFANSAEVSDDARYKLLHSGQDGPAKYLEAEIRDCFGPNGKDYVAKEMGRTYAELAFAS